MHSMNPILTCLEASEPFPIKNCLALYGGDFSTQLIERSISHCGNKGKCRISKQRKKKRRYMILHGNPIWKTTTGRRGRIHYFQDVTKKIQHANHAVTKIRMITTNYDSRYLYTETWTKKKRIEILKADKILKRQFIPSHFKQKLYQNHIL